MVVKVIHQVAHHFTPFIIAFLYDRFNRQGQAIQADQIESVRLPSHLLHASCTHWKGIHYFSSLSRGLQFKYPSQSGHSLQKLKSGNAR